MSIMTTGGSQSERDFQAKMQERMRAAMGDLMPDEVLKEIVARGIEEAFFKKQKRIINTSSWNQQVEEYPSWLVEFLQKEAEHQTKEAVKQWVADNKDKVADILKKVLEGGLASATVRAFDSLFTEGYQQLFNHINDVVSKLRHQ